MTKIPRAPKVVRPIPPPAEGRRRRYSNGGKDESNDDRSRGRSRDGSDRFDSNKKVAGQKKLDKSGKKAQRRRIGPRIEKIKKIEKKSEKAIENTTAAKIRHPRDYSSLNQLSGSARKWGPTAGIVMLGLALILGVIFLAQYFWRVEEVIIIQIGSESIQTNLLAQVINEEAQGEPLLFKNWEAIIQKRPELIDEIKTLRVKKILPKTLVAEIEGPHTEYAILLSNNELWARKETGRLRQETLEQNQALIVEVTLPQVAETLRQEGRVISFYDQVLLDLTAWMKGDPGLGGKIKKVWLDEEEKLRLILTNDREIILDQTDLSTSWQRWRYLVESLPPSELEKFEWIDLRFERPVAWQEPILEAVEEAPLEN